MSLKWWVGNIYSYSEYYSANRRTANTHIHTTNIGKSQMQVLISEKNRFKPSYYMVPFLVRSEKSKTIGTENKAVGASLWK